METAIVLFIGIAIWATTKISEKWRFWCAKNYFIATGQEHLWNSDPFGRDRKKINEETGEISTEDTIKEIRESRMKKEIPYRIIGWLQEPTIIEERRCTPEGDIYEARALLQDRHGKYIARLITNERMMMYFPRDDRFFTAEIEAEIKSV